MTSRAEPTIWIDTNTVLEVDSVIDLFREFDRERRGELGRVEYRRVRAQDSLWMAMALCRSNAVSTQYAHEVLNQLYEKAAPGTELGWWTRIAVFFFGDHGVFDGWTRFASHDGADLRNRERDRRMIDLCLHNRLTLITRDEQTLAEADALGVDVVVPEEYAARVLSRLEARAMFRDRVEAAIALYASEIPESAEAMSDVLTLYSWLWVPPVSQRNASALEEVNHPIKDRTSR